MTEQKQETINAVVRREIRRTARYRNARRHRALHLTLAVLLMVLGITLVATALFLPGGEGRWFSVVLGVLFLISIWTQLAKFRVLAGELGRIERIVRRGKPVIAYVVQANSALFSSGKQPLPCLVLITFQEDIARDYRYMVDLARQMFALKGTEPLTADARLVASFATNETAVLDQRRTLPVSFTDGSTIYCADLWIDPTYLRHGFLTERHLFCVAETGESGGILLAPFEAAPR